MCDDHFSRRSFLHGAGALAASAVLLPQQPGHHLPSRLPLRSPVRPADGSGNFAYSMAMHVHTSFSEYDGSMDSQLYQATANAVDVMWWTDHDHRMNGLGYRDVVHFTSLTAEKGAPGQGGAWHWQQRQSGSLRYAPGSGIVTSPCSPNDPVAAGSLFVTVKAKSGGTARRGFYANCTPAGWNYRDNLNGQSLSFDVLLSPGWASGYLEILINTSYHEASAGRPAGGYSLSYRLAPSGTGSSTAQGNQGIITIPVTPAAAGDWTTITIQVQEKDPGGAVKHTTGYTYDADSNLKTRTHDGAESDFTYDTRNLLATQKDTASPSDTIPHTTQFTQYTPDGLLQTETKPNGNKVAYTYYADQLLQHQLETTPAGATVAEHNYGYNADGAKNSDTEKLMSADDPRPLLTHTLAYSYDPRDRLTKVTKDGTTAELYAHDASDNVTSQTINKTTTNFSYDRDRLMSANGGAITYNYDPLGRLDTVTGSGRTVETNAYDGFDNIAEHQQLNTAGTGMDKTDYTYDPLNRLTSQAVNGGTPTSYSYLGLSGELTGEVNSSSGLNKAYSYTPGGQRLAQYTPGTTATNLGYYSYNDHNDVEAVTGSTKATGGATTATYGYTAYGQPDPGQFTGNDKNNVNPSPATQPYNSYRFNAMRWDSGSGQYDMGFRNYAPGLNQFLSRDMYNGALADMQLTTDPFTGNRYTFAAGNPITNIELDGHTQCDAGICPTQRQTQQVTQAAARYGAGCPSTEPGCPGYQTPASGNDGSQCGMFMPDCTNPCVRSPSLCTGLGTQLNDGSQNGIGNKRTWNMLGRVCPAAVAVLICPIAAAASGEGGEGGQPTGGGSGSKLPWFEDLIANALNAAKAAMDERGIFGALKTYRQWLGARAAVRLDLGGNTYVGASGRGIQQIKGTLSMFVGHAEGDAFSQALESGIDYEGQSGTLYVSKMDEPPGPCSMCQSQITNVARRMGIAELTTYTPEGYFGSWDPVNGWDIP